MHVIPINNICHSTINGHGNRLVIWIQGCPFKCDGCFNPETHPLEGGKRMSPSKLARIINEDKTIEGVTLSGGEPLMYPQEIQMVLAKIRKRLTRIVFTGFTVEEILADEAKRNILPLVDLVIAGRYHKSLPHPFFGKKLIKITDRVDVEYFKPTQRVEYSINGDSITKTGIFKHT